MIDILMATYNGEKYIDTQIASIINQTFKDWKLYIHDDGSTDKTVDCIKKWLSFDKRIVYIDDSISYHNSGKNFLHLLKYSKGDYVCFSDQDDYWLDNKLEEMLYNFPDVRTPHLLNTACYLWDSVSGTINYDISYDCPKRIEEILFKNGGLQGCAIMFNSALRALALEQNIDCYSMHDLFITLLGYCYGTINHLAKGLSLYRNHQNTVTRHHAQTRINILKEMIVNRSPVVTNLAYNDIKNFVKNNESKLNKRSYQLFQKYLVLPKKCNLIRFLKVLFSRFSISENGRIKLLLKILINPYYR